MTVYKAFVRPHLDYCLSDCNWTQNHSQLVRKRILSQYHLLCLEFGFTLTRVLAMTRTYSLDYCEVIMMRLRTKNFTRILNLFNTMPANNLQEKNFTMNQAWNPSNLDVGTGNFACFKLFSKKIDVLTISIEHQLKIRIITPEIQIKLLYFTLNITFEFFLIE